MELKELVHSLKSDYKPIAAISKLATILHGEDELLKKALHQFESGYGYSSKLTLGYIMGCQDALELLIELTASAEHIVSVKMSKRTLVDMIRLEIWESKYILDFLTRSYARKTKWTIGEIGSATHQ
jgi:hypothetical protein